MEFSKQFMKKISQNVFCHYFETHSTVMVPLREWFTFNEDVIRKMFKFLWRNRCENIIKKNGVTKRSCLDCVVASHVINESAIVMSSSWMFFCFFVYWIKNKTEIATIDFPYALALIFFLFWNMITIGVIERLFSLEFWMMALGC